MRGAAACVAILGALVGLVAEAAPGAPASKAAVSRRHAQCRASGLDVWIDTSGNGAAGSAFYKLEFTNLSRRPCTLRGYPRVWAASLSGHRLGSTASREASGGPGTVRLAVGASASAVLREVQAGNFPVSACRPVTAAGLRVYPPGQPASRFVPFPFRACSRAGHGNLSVRAVRSG